MVVFLVAEDMLFCCPFDSYLTLSVVMLPPLCDVSSDVLLACW